MNRLTRSQIDALAAKLALLVHSECGGFRVVDNEHNNIFPADGTCPVATKQQVWIFLQGVLWERTRQRLLREVVKEMVEIWDNDGDRGFPLYDQAKAALAQFNQ